MIFVIIAAVIVIGLFASIINCRPIEHENTN